VLLWAGLVAMLPWQASFAYIDPGSAGPLYQLLFPLLVTIASAFAFFRRALKRAWDRVVSAVVSLRGGASAAEHDPPG
jgi:hypothetical protein